MRLAHESSVDEKVAVDVPGLIIMGVDGRGMELRPLKLDSDSPNDVMPDAATFVKAEVCQLAPANDNCPSE